MKKTFFVCLVLGLLLGPIAAQQEAVPAPESQTGKIQKEKGRPPRIPDGPFVPKRGMIQREKGQFWAGPPDEGRFAQILSLTLVPKDRLQEKLSEWPNFQELSPEQRDRLVERIDQVREAARKQALEVVREFGLQVSPDQEDQFVRMYWKERVEMDQTLKQELSTKRKKLEEESEARILKRFPKDINH